jgi:hypothetical protein
MFIIAHDIVWERQFIMLVQTRQAAKHRGKYEYFSVRQAVC